MKNYLILILCLYIIISCSSPKYVYVDELSEEYKNTSIRLKDYDLYTFKMVKDTLNTDVPIEKRPFMNSVQSEKNHLVYEELYLLFNKNKRDVLYITTFTHKYIYKDGVFNHKENDSIVYFNEVEYIFHGVRDTIDNELRFRNPGNGFLKTLYIGYEHNNDVITLTTVPNVNPIQGIRRKKPIVNLNEMFGVPLQFKKDNRTWYFKDCVDVGTYEVDSLYHNNSHYIFHTKRDQEECALIKLEHKKNKIKYFLDANASH
ncbi:hypothetical protein [Tenacibaculum sp. 190524A05c]|uniref:hypothetical protein n=1 Tax=Tenacibaculum platacis TaxID=3137852 RepID=UPI0032B0F140